jgi:hypothetical protein
MDDNRTCAYCHQIAQGDDKRVLRDGKVYCPYHTPDKTQGREYSPETIRLLAAKTRGLPQQ